MKKRRNGKNKGLRKSEQRGLEEKVQQLVGQNLSDEEISLELNLQPHVLRHYRQRVAEKVAFNFRKQGRQGVFENYAKQGLKSIQELEVAISEMRRKARTTTAVTQAIRLQNNIVRDVIRLAHDLGLITKRTRSVTVDGFMFQSPTKHTLKSV